MVVARLLVNHCQAAHRVRSVDLQPNNASTLYETEKPTNISFKLEKLDWRAFESS